MREGCVVSPVMFNVFMDQILCKALEGNNNKSDNIIVIMSGLLIKCSKRLQKYRENTNTIVIWDITRGEDVKHKLFLTQNDGLF